MQFDDIPDRRGSNCSKWDQMEARFGVPSDDGLAMWVADMDFPAPDPVRDAVRAMADHGVFGYPGSAADYEAAVAWWMAHRHGWEVPEAAILSTPGLVNAVALCVDVWTDPGDGIVLFTPVYHAFARVIRAAGREVVECPLARIDGRYVMDLDAYDALIRPSTRMAILCSPHNPGGTVWQPGELRDLAQFAETHDLLLVSDEVHHDLVYRGHRHTPTACAAPDSRDRLVTLTAASKTFNIAGAHVGNVLIEDGALRAAFASRLKALALSPNAFALAMVPAAYSAAGAVWCDALVAYLATNRQLFDSAIDAIPGATSMPLAATYLAWVDFAGTGMTLDEIIRRVEGDARIAANHGPSFGSGGETFLRFNLGTSRARVAAAGERLQAAFADLQ